MGSNASLVMMTYLQGEPTNWRFRIISDCMGNGQTVVQGSLAIRLWHTWIITNSLQFRRILKYADPTAQENTGTQLQRPAGYCCLFW